MWDCNSMNVLVCREALKTRMDGSPSLPSAVHAPYYARDYFLFGLVIIVSDRMTGTILQKVALLKSPSKI